MLEQAMRDLRGHELAMRVSLVAGAKPNAAVNARHVDDVCIQVHRATTATGKGGRSESTYCVHCSMEIS